MSFVVSGSPQSGLASAAALLQVELGIGLILGVLGIASTSTPALKKQLAATPWEATWRAAAKAVAPVPVLVASALLQAQAAPDVFVSVGFLVASTAVVLGAFVAVLEILLGSDEGDNTPRFLKATRVLSACRAFGQALLVFTAMPEGTQLITASCFVRAALFTQAVGAAIGALSLACAPAGILADLESASLLAPVFAALALLESAAWGQGSLAGLPLQPAFYALVQMGLAIAGHFAGDEVVRLRRLVAVLLNTAMALALGITLAGSFTMELTVGGIFVQWGDPLTATAMGLCILILGVHIAGYVSALLDEPEVAKTNGINGNDDHEHHVKPPTVTDYLKALIAPTQVLLLALMAVRMMFPPMDADMDTVDRISFLAVAPFRFGLLLAAMAVWLQVVSFMVYAVGHAGAEGILDPPFDATGTLIWEAHGKLSKQVAEGARMLTHGLLEGGLLMGCIGLGPLTWVMGGGATMGFLFLAAPEASRNQAIEVSKAILSALLACGGSCFAGLDALMEKNRQAQMAKASARAAAAAEALEKESAPKGRSSIAAKGGPKGPVAKAPAVEKKDVPQLDQASPQKPAAFDKNKKGPKGSTKKK